MANTHTQTQNQTQGHTPPAIVEWFGVPPHAHIHHVTSKDANTQKIKLKKNAQKYKKKLTIINKIPNIKTKNHSTGHPPPHFERLLPGTFDPNAGEPFRHTLS